MEKGKMPQSWGVILHEPMPITMKGERSKAEGGFITQNSSPVKKERSDEN